MHVYGPAHLHGAQPVNAPHISRLAPPTAPRSTAIEDELQISDAAQMMGRVHDMPDIRQDLVQRIRSEIASGAYETDEKLDVALGRLLDEIG
jgi:anti-sigma28 factor (negative regulator of flagellin synthesis)